MDFLIFFRKLVVCSVSIMIGIFFVFVAIVLVSYPVTKDIPFIIIPSIGIGILGFAIIAYSLEKTKNLRKDLFRF